MPDTIMADDHRRRSDI